LFDERMTLRVGAVLFALLVAGVVFALQFDTKNLGSSVRIQVFLGHPGPLRANADLQIGGRKVGSVRSIRVVTAKEATPTDHLLHPDGGVVLSVQVKTRYLEWFRKNSEVFVSARSILGQAYLEITPPPGEEQMQRPIKEGDKLRGIDPARREHILVTGFLNARRLEALLEELRPSQELLKQELDTLAKTLDELSGPDYDSLRQELKRTRVGYSDLHEKLQGVDRELVDSARRLGKRALTQSQRLEGQLHQLSTQIQNLQTQLGPELSAKLTAFYEEAQNDLQILTQTLAQLEALKEGIALGQGTVGALINDPEFSDDAKQLGRYLKRHPWKLITKPR
jgi:ABC-type transporter Mla subunit MlaD